MKQGITQTIIDNPGLSPSHRYKSEKGEISMVRPTWYTNGQYEIYCIDGELFDDVERYETLGEAEARIEELL